MKPVYDVLSGKMDNKLPIRKHTRLRNFNYARAGYYFVTICVHRRRTTFGAIADGQFIESENGATARTCWKSIPLHNPLTHLDEFVIMPNHVHGIIVLEWTPAGDACVAPTVLRNAEIHPDHDQSGPDRNSLAAAIGSYKSAVSKQLRWKSRHKLPLWQRSFFDRVIRTDEELHAIREYIVNNPLSWHLDELNAKRTGRNTFYDWLNKSKS